MGLNKFTVDFQNIGEQQFLRPNFGYRYFFDIQNAEIYPTKDSIKLKYVLNEMPMKKVSKGELEESEILIDIGNIERRFNNLINLVEVDRIGSDKNIMQYGDIIIPKLQPQMGNIFLNSGHKRFIGSTELLEYKINENYNPIFIYYLITSNKFLFDLAKLESGKAHRRVNSVDLLKIRIPLISKESQDLIVAQIWPIEKKINELKKQIEQPQNVINKVFAREFGFDLEKYEKLKKDKFSEVDLKDILRHNFVRISFHFHHKTLIAIENKLKNKNYWAPVNSLFSLFGGKRIPKGKSFSNIETDYYYLRPTEVSIWGIDKINVPFIPVSIYDQLKRYKIVTDEFCISIVGTLGKTALINTDILDIGKDNLILSENFIKLKPKKHINSLFYIYFFYSFIFEAQINREYTITSIKKLGIDKWNNIKIPCISIIKQQKIVDEIKGELDKQEKFYKKIEMERDKIDEIIEKVIIRE
ncbi:MAG: hypothetical protein WC528_01595 [Patescibacteria group bacterium]